MKIRYEQCAPAARKVQPAPGEELGFGIRRTNHMFLAEYKDGVWQDARIVPYGPLCMGPGAMCLHYSQNFFEGAKAFKHADGEIYTFRLDKNAERFNFSADVLCMPQIDAAMQLEAIHRLIDIDRDFCPTQPESSLYIRPFMFATEDCLGVRPSNEYTFCVFLSPSGPYYTGGFSSPVKLLISTSFHRAAPGGMGASKAGGNYAASLRAGQFAKKSGASQVLYLNTANTHIEEAGAMNHFHVLKDGTFIIPPFTDSILRSITAVSVLELAEQGLIKARQEPVAIAEFIDGIKSGEIIEAGGVGTAAVISPVGSYLLEDGTEITVADGKIGKHSRFVYEHMTSMQRGSTPAPKGWMQKVPHYPHTEG
ncbi:branched-chain amino acid aminotransferase [Desulfovibrio cuneatus]|uniref:branched-chain amino acid aminotransferase n=1 Tax=Desulfovibrio cuneatus TaxID=159728 RepID=UPI000417660C|nr:branched-chain amino acid aminotransferase [Desulfovibrio cuneatus]